MKSVRASTQVIDGTITNALLEDDTLTNAKISPTAAIDLAKLADVVIKADGTQFLTADWDLSAGAFTILAPDPSATQEVATKNYVDMYAQGLALKGSVLAATTVGDGDISMSGTAATIDGESLSVDDRVLLTQQADPIENGIWLVQLSTWVRPADFADGKEAAAAYMFVQQGSSYNETAWVCTNDTGSDIIGTHGLAFVQFSGAGSYTASGGLQLTGTDFSIAPLGVDTSHIAANAVDDSHIDFGGGAGQVNAKDLPFPAGHTYGGSAADVMDGLEELWGRWKTNAGNPNGSVNGVQGDILKDTSNNIFYICRTTGSPSSDWVVL